MKLRAIASLMNFHTASAAESAKECILHESIGNSIMAAEFVKTAIA